ncbi:MAG TPA: cytochrome c [Candidatus Binatia bacterium]|jgi:cytochrome c556
MANRNVFILALGSLFALMISMHAFAEEDIVKKRKDFMSEQYDSLKAIKKAVEQKDYATVELKAKDIMGSMDKVPDYFPKGSITEKSRAKPEIWEKPDEFKRDALKVKEVAGELAKAASARDESRVQTQFKALGNESPFKSGACSECHREFRSSPPPAKKSEG